MNSGDDTSCYTNLSSALSLQMYSNHHQDHDHDHDDGSVNTNTNTNINDKSNMNAVANTLVYGLSIIKDKLHQLQYSLIPNPNNSNNINPLLFQEIITTANSMLLSLQHHTNLNAPLSGTNNNIHDHHNYNPAMNDNNINISPSHHHQSSIHNLPIGNAVVSYPCTSTTLLDWPYVDHQNYSNNNTTTNNHHHDLVSLGHVHRKTSNNNNNNNYEIVELGAADLLAKYTHYCQVCGKGFKRDANLRMHMRAHGDEYKTSAALSNPAKSNNNDVNVVDELGARKKYSCPQQGCRWNQRHAKFQPLKSMICVKNHYKRSHCPKMYVCKRCNRKHFSVLSDLRTHEKHCGDLKWQCSCGTTFSRKDKLMGHVALFIGHSPVNNNMLLNSSSNNKIKVAKVENQLDLSQITQNIDIFVKMIE